MHGTKKITEAAKARLFTFWTKTKGFGCTRNLYFYLGTLNSLYKGVSTV